MEQVKTSGFLTKSSPLTFSMGRPTVLRVKGKKKKKKKYSRGLKGIQKFAFRSTKVPFRLVNAWSSGLKTWRRKSAKSSRKRRDGIIRDGFKNTAKAYGKVIRVTGKTPKDFVRALNPLQIVKPRQIARFWGKFWPGR